MAFWTIHIGIRKTGSKALQRFLLERSRTAPAELCYPKPGREGVWHEPIDSGLRDEEDTLLAKAVQSADPTRHAQAVLSCEGFYTLPPHALRLLRRHLGEARIVMFLRKQDHAINSLLNQYAKAHRVSHSEIMSFRTEATSLLPEFDYARILNNWEDAFGPNSVVPLIYDKDLDMVAAFCDAIGLRPPDEEGPDLAREDGRVADNPNPALSLAGYEAFLAAKKAVHDPADLPGVVNELRHRHRHELLDTRQAEPPWLFDAVERTAIMAHYNSGNEMVRARWFPHRSTLF